ncbi:cupin domain-containing protein [Bradyrhizobium sp. SSUT112]|nr:cupin domain-containing protein [Bradyrhizobium sp. SSUT112]MDH2352576.1 cupin domain-containing protein [Bradyrhizobium sp. SSUT112]
MILYHYVVEGELHIRVDGADGEDLVLRAGDVVLLPRNDLHLVGSDLNLPLVAGSDIIHPPKGGRTVHDPSRRRRETHTDDLRVPRLR